MKKKSFYNNKKRNTKWTEKEVGRKISFADKYIEAGTGSDKFDRKRPKQKQKKINKDKTLKVFKSVFIVIFCFIFLSVGYSAMDLYIERNAMPETAANTDSSASFSEVNLMLKSLAVPSLSLDDSVMLDSVINSAEDEAYNAVTFDLKRDDGTIGYESKLATIMAYGAVTSPASELEKSIKKLTNADIIPVGRISCYKDNIITRSDIDSAIKNGKSIYYDNEGYAYLNPNDDTAYNYIKSIIEETKAMGITVFLLDNTTVPAEVSGTYSDGFTELAKKIYSEFGTDIKLIEAIDEDITDPDVKESEALTDENGNSLNTSTTLNSEEFTNGYGDVSEEETTEKTNKRVPLTDEDGDIIYGNDGHPVYSTQEQTEETTVSSDSLEGKVDDRISTKSRANKMYYIKTNNTQKLKKILDNKKITNYVIVSEN